MKSLTRQEAESYIRQSGLTASANTLAFVGKSKAATLVISTEGKDGLTVFDLARFICAHFSSADEVTIWVDAREPSTQAEESRLFDSFIRSAGEQPSDCLLFQGSETEALAIILALGLLYRWDFWIAAPTSGFVAQHSHDIGMSIFSASSEMLAASKQLGLGLN